MSTRRDTAVVEFDDGHRAEFEGYAHGAGYAISGMQFYKLYRDDVLVVHYDVRLYQVGPQPNEHRFVTVAAGYTHELIVSYWDAARAYLQLEYFEKAPEDRAQGNDDLWYPWMLITSHGWIDLDSIREGRTPLPTA